MLGIAKIANDEKQKGHTGIGFLTGGTIGGIGGYMAGGHLGAEKGREEYRIPGMFRARDEINKDYKQKEDNLKKTIDLDKQDYTRRLSNAKSDYVSSASELKNLSFNLDNLSRMRNQEIGDKKIKSLNPETYFNTSRERMLGMDPRDADHIEAERENQYRNIAVKYHGKEKDRLARQIAELRGIVDEKENNVLNLGREFRNLSNHDTRLNDLNADRKIALDNFATHPAYREALEEGAQLGRQRGGIQGATLGLLGLGLAGAAIGHKRKQTRLEKEEGL